jgi:7-cyano-7-deazaguanine reductase
MNLKSSLLGKEVDYGSQYHSEILFPIVRIDKRNEIGVTEKLPFFGMDIWNHYEVSWLDLKGKPIVAIADISYDCASPCIIESKSMKLYFNSFNNTKFKNALEVQNTIKNDIEKRVGAPVSVRVLPLDALQDDKLIVRLNGICLDELDIECSSYMADSSYLKTSEEVVNETVYSNLLKSNCLVTNQPDWGTVQITYTGNKIDHEGLLKYIVSFRNHNEFHEQCIERIFMDIFRHCRPIELTVYGRYTRRGGLDINPYRTTNNQYDVRNTRLYRQ